MERNVRPILSHSNSFGNDAEKDTAGYRASHHKSIAHHVPAREHPWMLADVDRLVTMQDGSTAILECKIGVTRS